MVNFVIYLFFLYLGLTGGVLIGVGGAEPLLDELRDPIAAFRGGEQPKYIADPFSDDTKSNLEFWTDEGVEPLII